MEMIIVPKPIRSELQIAKKFKELVLKDLPIHRWEFENKEKQNKIKL